MRLCSSVQKFAWGCNAVQYGNEIAAYVVARCMA